MAHNVLTRANLAAWGATPAVSAAEFWSLDSQVFASINGDAGGTWAPAAAIVIGGLGIDITGPASLTNVGTLESDGGAWLMANGGTVTIDSGATLEIDSTSSISVNSGGFINIQNGADLDVKSGGEIDIENGGSIVVASGAVITVQSGGAVSVEGLSGLLLGASSSISATSGSKVTGTLSQECRLTKTGAAARTPQRYHTATADTSAYFDCSYDTEFYSHTVGTTAVHTLRITGGTQNPVDGDELWFHVENTGGGIVSFVNEGLGSQIATISGAGEYRLKFGFRSTMWRLLMAWNSSGMIAPGAHA